MIVLHVIERCFEVNANFSMLTLTMLYANV